MPKNPRWNRVPSPIERASPIDQMELAVDVGPLPLQVGAILMLAAGSPSYLFQLRAAINERIVAVPRLRQRLVQTSFGCGRPVWVDDPNFEVDRHVHRVTCPTPGDEQALLDIAARIVTDPLPQDRPLWSATLVSELSDDTCALVVVFHHALSDGMGGLAMLRHLGDGMQKSAPPGFPRPRPGWLELAFDAQREHLAVLSRTRNLRPRLRAARSELAPKGTDRAPRCSLLCPVGNKRRLGVARADLARVRAVAKMHGGGIPDVVLDAVTGALRELLESRGERISSVVVGVAVSGRLSATVGRLGNQVGMMLLELPLTGASFPRLDATIRARSRRRQTQSGSSAFLLAPLFRVLRSFGLLRLIVNHQRRVNVFFTYLPGPRRPVKLLGTAITEVIPISVAPGNVSVVFTAISYRGQLVVNASADSDAHPDLSVLIAALQNELNRLTLEQDPKSSP